MKILTVVMVQVRPGMDLSRVVLPTFILEPRLRIFMKMVIGDMMMTRR